MIKNPGTRSLPGFSALLAGLLLLATACRDSSSVPPGFQGLVEYDQRIVSFEVPGRVDRVDVQKGDVVKEGQSLAHLEDALEQLTAEARRQDTAAAQADLNLLLAGSRREDIAAVADDLQAAITAADLARTTDTRTQSLFAQGALPKAEVDRADSDLARATAERKSLEQRLGALKHGARPEEIARARVHVEQTRAAYALEQEILARHSLKAAAAGEVLDVTTKVGELAAVGTPAVTLADTTHPYVDVFVPEGEIAGVRPGARAELRVDSVTAPLESKVEYVSPDTEFTPKFLFSDRERPHLVVRVRVRVQDPERRLHAGLPAFARITP